MADYTERLARQAIALSENIVGDLLVQGRQGAPLQYVLNRAKHCSARALTELVSADPEIPRVIRELQFQAELYGRMVQFVREAVEAGLEADGTYLPIPMEDAAELYHDVMDGHEGEGETD
jgi:hypothetical protein